jgi:hypothetical protein
MSVNCQPGYSAIEGCVSDARVGTQLAAGRRSYITVIHTGVPSSYCFYTTHILGSSCVRAFSFSDTERSPP